MKKPISHELVKGKLFIALLFIFIASTNLCWAQVIPPVPPPTKVGCFRFNMAYQPCGSSWTDNYNGVTYNCFCDCSSITANDCVPSSSPGQADPGQGSIPYQTNPGDVSNQGPLNGNPFFSSHPSMSFEEWSSEYKQLLESYGVTSILGNEDKYFKLLYHLWAERFKPKVQPPPLPPPPPPLPGPPTSAKINEDASVVDLSSSSGVVSLLTTEEEQKNRDKWYQESIQEQGYTNLIEIGNDDVINGEKIAERSWSEAILRTALGRIDGLEGKIASWELNVADETFDNLKQAISTLVSGDDEKAYKLGNELLGGKVVFNASKTFVTEQLIDAGSDKIHKVGIEKTSSLYKKRAVQSLVDEEKWGIGNLKKILEVAKDGRENAELGYKWGGIGIELWQNKKEN